MNNKDNEANRKRTFSKYEEGIKEDKNDKAEKNQIHIDKKLKLDFDNNLAFLSRMILPNLSNIVADYLKQWVELKTLSTHSEFCDNFIQSLAFSNDNKYLASSYEMGYIKLWDIKDNFNLCQTLNVIDMIISSKFASEFSSAIKEWTNERRNVDVVVDSLAFSNDNKHLAALVSNYNCITIFDVNNNFNLLHTITVNHYYDDRDSTLLASVYSPDNKYLVTSEEHEFFDFNEKTTGVLKIWDVNNNYNLVDTFRGHEGPAYSLSFSKNGKYLASAGGFKHIIKIWDFDDSSKTYKQCIASFDKLKGGHDDVIRSISFSSDSKQLASGDCNGIIKIWDMTTLKLMHCIKAHESWVTSLTYSPDNKHLIAGGKDKIIKIFDSATYQLKEDNLIGHVEISALVFSADKKYLASAEYHGALKIWQYKSRELE